MKILYLGNETLDTDRRVSLLALKNKTINNGLLSDPLVVPTNEGYYHTTVVDLTPGQIVKLSNQFDRVELLNQPAEAFLHYKTSVTIFRLFQDLEEANVNVLYKHVDWIKDLLHWRKFLKENKTFCFYPFLALVDNIVETTICPKSETPIKKSEDIINWQTDAEYTIIRNKMIAGEYQPEHCFDCYDRELEGQESTRQFETLEWTRRLNIKTIDDFKKYQSPIYYEFRPSNKCNVLCRTCDSTRSHLIKKEYKQIGIPVNTITFQNPIPYKTIDWQNLEKIYFAGGEPTVMPEFYDFLKKSIEKGKTDFELYIGTNGQFFSKNLLDLLDQFSKVCFSFSYDGHKSTNDYIRWGTHFSTVVNNSRILRDRGHTIALQTVFSMYSISRMHEVFEFFDQEYPTSGLLVQVAGGYNDIFMPFNHPFPELVLESMEKCKKTNTYYQNGRSIKSMIDLLHNYYSNKNYKINKEKLKEFFDFNDQLDQSRNSKLVDYIPELDKGKSFLL